MPQLDKFRVRIFCFYITSSNFRRALSLAMMILLFVRYGISFYQSFHPILLDPFFCPRLPTASHSSGGGSNSIVGVGSYEGSSSGWTSFDLDVLAEEEDEVARPLPHPIDPGTEDRIYKAVAAINTACQKEEAKMVEKAQTILKNTGFILTDDDKEDIARAINMALFDTWETEIDTRLEEFRKIRRYLGTKNCGIWKNFLGELLSLGNTKFDQSPK